MPIRERPLSGQPSLRYLKLEAKRRLAAGEFETLHDAYLAVAREYGQPSWAALKRFVAAPAATGNPALAQLRWVIARFKNAGSPGWAPPGDNELREHFDDKFLAAVPADRLVSMITSAGPAWRGDVAVTAQTAHAVRARIGCLDVTASAAPDPPHQLTGLRALVLGGMAADPRAAAPPPRRTSGEVPAWAEEAADAVLGELGLPGVVLAGGSPGARQWALAAGWADLDRGEVLQASHRFPASGVSGLVTAVAVLRLVAAGHIGLDRPANDYLHMVRLADDTVTVRELLASTGGIDSPAGPELLADQVPDLAAVTGPVISCGGPRGVVRPSNGGTAALGQLLAEVTATSFAVAAARLVLRPLGMNESSFPGTAAEFGPRAVSCYGMDLKGLFVPVPAKVCTLPAAGGLWATALDLARLGAGWASLLPAGLARSALAAVPGSGGGELRAGLGWFFTPRGDVAFSSGALPGSTASLLLRVRDGRVLVAVTTRLVPVGLIHAHVLRAWADAAR
jgi:CubicO group peptidase (beta-lactamase class C family)